jgi:hypothetical protein
MILADPIIQTILNNFTNNENLTLNTPRHAATKKLTEGKEKKNEIKIKSDIILIMNNKLRKESPS